MRAPARPWGATGPAGARRPRPARLAGASARRLVVLALLVLAPGALAPCALAASSGGAVVAPAEVRVDASGRTVRTFRLYATDGELVTADGRTLYVWGYSLEPVPGSATVPAPTLEVHEGDRVEVTLTNLGPARPGVHEPPHTIHLHGLDVDQANDGVPETSPSVRVGGSATYVFDATHAGTFWYHCHVETVEHLTMGMYGAVVVHPPGGPGRAFADGPAYDRSHTLVLSEMDPAWSDAVGRDESPERTRFDPRYFFVNGRSFPDTMAHGDTHVVARLGERVLLRFVNAGYGWRSMHLHGFHFEVVATDGRPLAQPYLKDTLSIGPGERYDVVFVADQLGSYPLHSHVLLDNQNDGVYPGGIHTMVTVVPEGAPLDAPLHGGHGAGPAAGAAAGAAATPPVAAPRGATRTLFTGAPSRRPGAAAGPPAGVDGEAPVPAATATERADVVIEMRSDRFHPEFVTVATGATVAFVNHDGRLHTVVSERFASADLPRGTGFVHTFDEAGTYRFRCIVHRGMSGAITVR